MHKRIHRSFRILPLIGLAFHLCGSPPLAACQICLPIPKSSVADALLGADLVAKARENPDSQIRTLAHLEVARAPYDTIRELRNVIPPQEIRSFLADFRYIEWHALYILLPILLPILLSIVSKTRQARANQREREQSEKLPRG